MLMKKSLRIFVAVLLLQLASSSMAMSKATDPLAMLQHMTNKVMVSLKKHRKLLESDPEILYNIVDKDIVPCIDVEEMARWIAGRNAWKSASANNKQRFIKEFKVLLVNTYATALKNYADKTTKFLPLRGEWRKKKRLAINSQVINNVGQVIRIDYRLIRHNEHWKVYDIVVEGVSLLKGYQSQFSDKIKKEGLKSVVEIIAHHNKKTT